MYLCDVQDNPFYLRSYGLIHSVHWSQFPRAGKIVIVNRSDEFFFRQPIYWKNDISISVDYIVCFTDLSGLQE